MSALPSVVSDATEPAPGRSPCLLLLLNDSAFFVTHRLPVALAAKAAGYDVHVATAPGAGVSAIVASGLTHHPIPLSRSGTTIAGELRTLRGIWQLFRRLRPDIVHCVTIKPVLYGGIMARITRVPALICAVSGMGFVFLTQGLRAQLRRAAVCAMYRLSLGHRNLTLIFQNPDDRQELLAMLGSESVRAVIIRGSGVDLAQYPIVARLEASRPVVVMASRLLTDKGVREFVDAARHLRIGGSAATFRLAGDIDSNPASISTAELDRWRTEGAVEVLGFRSDVAALFADCDVVVLPSYREGLPRVLIEAAACGRAVVTTDVPGCRDAIEPAVTGVLVPARDAVALAEAIGLLIRDRTLCRRMGAEGRALAERAFTIEAVIASHLRVYREAIATA